MTAYSIRSHFVKFDKASLLRLYILYRSEKELNENAIFYIALFYYRELIKFHYDAS